eukprot:7130165-Prymnesium_polylepis.1
MRGLPIRESDAQRLEAVCLACCGRVKVQVDEPTAPQPEEDGGTAETCKVEEATPAPKKRSEKWRDFEDDADWMRRLTRMELFA